jgi:hypothetical protein
MGDTPKPPVLPVSEGHLFFRGLLESIKVHSPWLAALVVIPAEAGI